MQLVYIRPRIHDGQDFLRREIGKREVVFCGECQDIASSRDRIDLQEAGRDAYLIIDLLRIYCCFIQLDKKGSVHSIPLSSSGS